MFSPIIVKGQLSTVDDFGAIVLRANPDGSNVRLRDVARIELGGDAYQFSGHHRQGGSRGAARSLGRRLQVTMSRLPRSAGPSASASPG